jgi:ketosteroid isomerase-like protein
MDALKTAQTIYEAFGRGDVPGLLAQLSPDVSWEHGAPDHGIPWLKPGRGIEHVAAFFGSLSRDLAIEQFDIKGFFVSGNEVIVTVDVQAQVKATGKRFRDFELHHWAMGADGKVLGFRHVLDTHQHWLACR